MYYLYVFNQLIRLKNFRRSFFRIPYWAYLLLLLTVVVNAIFVIARFHTSVTLESLWSLNPWLYVALYTLILIVCTTSVYILYAKPYDLTVRIFYIFLQLVAIIQNFSFIFLDSTNALFAIIVLIFSFNLFGAVLLHFHLIFPKPAPIYIKYKSFLKVVYFIGLLFGAILSVLMISRSYGDSDIAVSALNNFRQWSVYWVGLCLFLALIVVIYQFVISKNTLARKQLRLIFIGSFFGLVTPILFSAYPALFLKLIGKEQLFTVMEFSIGVGTYIMTSFMVIAIFRFKIWYIEPFIRRSIQYGAAIFVIYVTYLILFYLADIYAIRDIRMVHFIILATSILIFLLLKDTIQRLVDRLFHREKYDLAKLMTEIEDRLAGIYQRDVLVSSIVQSLNDIFHFKSFVFAIRIDQLSYKPVYLSGVDNYPLEKEFEITTEIDKLLRKTNVFVIETLNSEPEFFKISQGEMIVSLMKGNHPFGFFIVGPKISEESYSIQDIRVFSLLARRVIALFHTANLYQKDLDRQLMLERERTRIAKDVHDDVGASLTRISILSELVNNNASFPEKIKPWIRQIHDISHEVIQEMTQIIWALNPKNDPLEGLVAYIRRFAIEYFEPGPVKCTFDLPEELPGLLISGEIRRNIYLCIKESLHNIIKHAGATEVMISMKVNEEGLILKIKDDGKGFDLYNQESTGNGLINMKKRMSVIGGNFLIQSEENEGTEISLIAPIKTLV